MSVIPLPVRTTTMYFEKPNLEVYYPIVTGLNDKIIEQKINDQIFYHVNDLINKQGYTTDPDVEIMSSYEIKTNERNILSLILVNYAYFGEAHGYTIIKPLTFDMTTGNLLTLNDFFKEDSQYIENISSIIKQQIEERNLYTIADFNQISPDQDFYIADKSLVIFFQLYQLAPYSQGFPYFPISLFDIEYMNSEKSILNRLLTFY